jgi:hypothetical protein
MSMGMGSRNISISEDAYLRLRRARRHPGESFSQVIRRSRWDDEVPTAGSWLDAFDEAPVVSDEVLDALENNQHADSPPEDKWSC